MRVSDFDFDLPEELIALRPARPRDSARLLEVRHGELIHRHVRDLPSLLRPGDCIIFNDTAVIHAQLEGRRVARESAAGALAAEPRIDFTLHKRQSADTWRAFAKPGRKLAPGDRVRFGDMLGAEVIAKNSEGDFVLRFSAEGPALDALVDRLGTMPLPPYIASRRRLTRRTRPTTRRSSPTGRARSQRRRPACISRLRCWRRSSARACGRRA